MSSGANTDLVGQIQPASALGTKAPSPTDHQAERKKENVKRKRNHLSCAECRRLKLRCDRVFPCESCRKRGCAAICPEGALTTKGTRFVLASTEELHVKIMDMSERIRSLENALAAAHPVEPHPLLREDLLLVKVPVEFKNEKSESDLSPQGSSSPEANTENKDPLPTIVNAFGTLKIGSDGASSFFGQTARTEHFLKDDGVPTNTELPKAKQSLPAEVLLVSQAFPFGSQSSSPATETMQQILEFLPPLNEAWPLIDSYYSNSAWMYEPCPRPQFTEKVLMPVYERVLTPDTLSKHRLALVFATLAHGALMDLNREPYSRYSEQLHILARASLAISPLLEEPTLVSLQTMFLLCFYSFLINRKESPSAGWAILGLSAKLAQTLGLHRDLRYWKAEDEELGEARRTMFWEMLTLEGWTSLGLGRPATVHFQQIDCKWPAATERAMNAPDASLHSWHTWKHGLTLRVTRVLQKSLDAKTPPYTEILDLDRDIHKYSMTPDVEALVNGLPVRAPMPEELPGLTMQRWLLLQARSTAVLLLHRGFFAQALGEKNDPMQSKYAPSVLATYRSACHIIMALANTYAAHPALTIRFGLFWSNGFSASISLCLLVTRATKSSYAPAALQQLELVYELFDKASPECFPASKALPMVTKLVEKARAAYAPYVDERHPAPLASRRPVDNDDDELSALSGTTNVVSAPSKATPALISAKLEMDYTYPGSPGIPLQMPPTDHLDSVHPSLVQYLAQSDWGPDANGQHYVDHTYMHATMAPQPAPPHHATPAHHTTRSSLVSSLPPQNHAMYHQQELHYTSRVAPDTTRQQGYYTTYTTYPSNVDNSGSMPQAGNTPPGHRHPSRVERAGNWYDSAPGPGPQYANMGAYNHSGPSQGHGPIIEQPEPQPAEQPNQFATWQTYMGELGLPC